MQNTVTKFAITSNLITLIKMCVSKVCCRVCCLTQFIIEFIPIAIHTAVQSGKFRK